MIRAFLSLPMSGRSDDKILAQIKEMEEYVLNSHIFGDEEIEFVHNLGYLPLSNDDIASEPLLYLGEGWNKARGCLIERDIAKKYGIPLYHCNGYERMQRHVRETNSQK